MRITSVIAVTLITLTACGSPSNEAITIAPDDVVATKVNIAESTAAHRVVALANGSAEIIDALGMKNILVGRDIASTEPALKSVPIVTSGHQVIAEKVIALNPDLVIIDASVGPQQALDALRAASIKVVTIKEAWSVGEISSKVRAVSDAIGAPRSGVALAPRCQQLNLIRNLRAWHSSIYVEETQFTY